MKISMKVLLQRVSTASVEIENKTIASITEGLLIFVAFTKTDSTKILDKIVNKIINLRCFNDLNKKMNKSILEVGGSALIVSQFTLYADCKKGRRPSFKNSAPFEQGKELYEAFIKKCKEHMHVETGKYGADMSINLTNQGPVTIELDSEEIIK